MGRIGRRGRDGTKGTPGVQFVLPKTTMLPTENGTRLRSREAKTKTPSPTVQFVWWDRGSVAKLQPAPNSAPILSVYKTSPALTPFMKQSFLCSLVLVLICASVFAAGPTTRTWTDKNKRQVEATFLRIQDDEIFLQTLDEVIHRLPLANLVPEDQALAKTLKSYDPPTTGNKIDQLVAKTLVAKGLKPNLPSTDEQFLRRAYATIVGRIPSYEEAAGFLADTNPKKRDVLIDKLLDSDGYSSHLFNYFADMLRIMDDPNKPMERTLPYIQWLKTQLKENTPYNQIVFDLITADGKMQSNGATGYLLRDSGMLLDNLANTFAVFLGTDLACAQCHDHPFSDWTQKQFYELAAFFGATVTNLNAKQFTKGDPKDRIMNEMNVLAKEGGVDMKQYEGLVNDIINANRNEVRDINENRLRLPRDYKYKDGKPNDPVKPRLIGSSKEQQLQQTAQKPVVVSRVKSRVNRPVRKDGKPDNGGIRPDRMRDVFGAWLTSPDNSRFSLAIANRLWKRAFGAGVAEPVTNVDDPAVSSNPALLDYLGKEMVRLNFNLKEFQREIYKSSSWQRACTEEDVPMGVPYYFQGPLLQRLSAEQTWDSFMTLVLGSPDAYKGLNGTNLAKTIDLDLDKTTGKTMAMKVSAYKKLQEAEAARMGGGLGDAGGMMGGAKIVSYNGMNLLRAAELDQPAQPGHFLREFGQSARVGIDGSTRDGSTPQVLFLMNGPVQEMLTNPKSLIFRTMASKGTPDEKIESMFVSIFARRPTAAEKVHALKEIEAAGAEGYGNLIWAMITSLEFLFVQ